MEQALVVKKELAPSSPSESAYFAPFAPLREPPKIRVHLCRPGCRDLARELENRRP
jgi:hypothetical protein